jgi:hypothetical protein
MSDFLDLFLSYIKGVWQGVAVVAMAAFHFNRSPFLNGLS